MTTADLEALAMHARMQVEVERKDALLRRCLHETRPLPSLRAAINKELGQ